MVSDSENELHAVTFDCWGTLIYERDGELSYRLRVEALARIASKLGRHVGVDDARHALDSAWLRHFSWWLEGRASGASEIAEWSLAALQVSGEAREAGRDELTTAYASVTREVGVGALTGAQSTLEVLERKGIRRALICDTGFNSGEVVRELLASAGLLEGLEITIFSDEAGVPKPDPRVFEMALDALEVAAESSVHVGDLRRTDIAGARSLGMRTIRIRDHHDDQSAEDDADVVAHSHRHVQSLLGLDETEES